MYAAAPRAALPPTGDDWSFTWHEQGSAFGLRPFPAFAKPVRPTHYRQDCHTCSPPLRQGYTKSVSPNTFAMPKIRALKK